MRIETLRRVTYALIAWGIFVLLCYTWTIWPSVHLHGPLGPVLAQLTIAGVVVGLGSFFASGAFRLSIGRVTVGLLTLCAIALLFFSSYHLLWLKALVFFPVCLLTGLSTGAICRRVWGLQLPTDISLLLTFVVFHYVLFGFALSFVFTQYVIAPLISIFALHGLQVLKNKRMASLQRLRDFVDSMTGPEAILYVGIFFVFSCAFVASCAPEIYSDAAKSHIPYMANLVRRGGLVPNYYLYGHLQPFPFQLLGASTYLFLGQLGAKWFTFLVGACGIVLVSREVFAVSNNRVASLTAGFLLLTVPYIWLWLTTAYYDWPMTVFCLATFSCFRRFVRGDIAYLPLVGVFSGFAVSVKFNAALFVAPLILFGALLFPAPFAKLFRENRRHLFLTVGFFVATLVPWLALVWHWTGNPFFPFLNGYFKSPYVSTEFLKQVFLTHHMLFKFPLGLWDLFAWPWSLTFETKYFGELLNGMVGPWFLAMFFPAAVLNASGIAGIERTNDTSRLVVLLVLTAFLYLCGTVTLMQGTPYLRFWLPALALFFLAGGISMPAFWRFLPPVTYAVQSVLSALLVSVALLFHIVWGVRINYGSPDGIAWNLYRGKVTRDEYLLRKTGGVYKYINANLKPDESVLALGYYELSEIKGFAVPLGPILDLNLGPQTLETYSALVRKLNVRYWIVSDKFLGGSHGVSLFQKIGVAQKYWTRDLLVYSSDGFSVYTTKPGLKPVPIATDTIAGRLGSDAWIVNDSPNGYDSGPTKACSDSRLMHDLPLPRRASSISGAIRFDDAKPDATVIVDVIWFEGPKIVRREPASMVVHNTSGIVRFVRQRPSAANKLRIVVRTWKRADECVDIKDARFEWWP